MDFQFEMDAKDDKSGDAESTKSGVFPIPAAQRPKRCAMDFYTNTLGAPKYVVSVCLSVYLFDLPNTECLNLVDTNGIKSIFDAIFFRMHACVRMSTSKITFEMK